MYHSAALEPDPVTRVQLPSLAACRLSWLLEAFVGGTIVNCWRSLLVNYSDQFFILKINLTEAGFKALQIHDCSNSELT